MIRSHAEEAIACIARRLPVERLQKLLDTAYAIEAEDPTDLRRTKSERTARAERRAAEVLALRAAGRELEASKAEREP